MLAGIGDSARKLQSGYEDQLARVARAIRRAIEVRVDLVHDETGPRQQVLSLETGGMESSPGGTFARGQSYACLRGAG
jgi:hypothetical protein